MNRRGRSSGFALIMALLVLVIAATVLTATARRVSELALRAGAQEQELQVRWGTESCRAICMEQAENLLAAAAGTEPAASRTVEMKLGKIGFRVTVADEQAKANANRLWERRGDAGVMAAVQHLQFDVTHPLMPRLRPDSMSGPVVEGKVPFTGYDQVVAMSGPEQLINGNGSATLAKRMTLWGSGKVNIRRAEPAVMREMLSGVLMEDRIAGLIEKRKQTPEASIEELIDAHNLTPAALSAVREAATDNSRCHSALVVATGRTRSWQRLYVTQEDAPVKGKMNWRFAW